MIPLLIVASTQLCACLYLPGQGENVLSCSMSLFASMLRVNFSRTLRCGLETTGILVLKVKCTNSYDTSLGHNMRTRSAGVSENEVVETTLSFLSVENLFEAPLCQPVVIKTIAGRK